jgi:hypothetical protein
MYRDRYWAWKSQINAHCCSRTIPLKILMRFCSAHVFAILGGVVLCGQLTVYSQAGSVAQGNNPIAFGVVLDSNAVIPLMTMVGDRVYNCWPQRVDSEETRDARFPMPMQSVPPAWIAPAATLPPQWTVFSPTGTNGVVRSLEVVSQDDVPAKVAIRTTSGPAPGRDDTFLGWR